MVTEPSTETVDGQVDDDGFRPLRFWTWRKVVILAATIAGTGVATFLTIVHYVSVTLLVCPHSAIFNCETVTTSKQSMIFGIPVAVLGLAYFVAMFALALPWAWRSTWRVVASARLASAFVGVGFISYLIYLELFVIHAICLWCTSVHVLTFVIFVAVVTGWEEATDPWYEDGPELA